MTTVQIGVGKATLPTVQEIRDTMKASPGVLIAAIIVAGFVAMGMLVAVVVLAWQGRDTAAILTVVNTLVTAVTLKSVYDVKATAAKVAEQTNGMQTKLVDHVLSQGDGSTS